jgi:hypothetical protein
MELGEKYGELGEMVGVLKENLKRVVQKSKQSNPLPIKMQHVYEYSKWDSIHEPYNVVENVLGDDDRVYKALQPTFDFNLDDHYHCYISEILVWPGECGPF